LENGIEISLALFIAVIARIGIGMLWYSRLLFGKKWMALINKSQSEINQESAKKMYLLEAGASLLMAYVLERVLVAFQVKTLTDATLTALWIGVGFMMMGSLGDYLFLKRSKALYFINNGYQVVSVIVMAIILVKWG